MSRAALLRSCGRSPLPSVSPPAILLLGLELRDPSVGV